MSKSENFKIVVCASGGGGNFQAMINSATELEIEIILLITDRECGAVNRAKSNSIPYLTLNNLTKTEFALALNQAIPNNTDLIVLAGFMPIIPKSICDKWHNKIINTHPSLLPKYGGKGMYGVKVHEAVIQAHEKITGCTVHYVNEKIDSGAIILQKTIIVDHNETPWQLGGRVFQEENKLLINAIKLIKKHQRK